MDASIASLMIRSPEPFNAETPLPLLRAAFLTEQRNFYVRCHGEVPRPDVARHRLLVDGLVTRPLDLSMDALRAGFAHRSVTSVLQCAGNRRAELHRVHPVTGDPWTAGAIGNARWSGVALADVLHAAGADTGEALHVAFEACDTIDMPEEGRFRFGVSIPMTKALCPDVLLAFAMNGEALAPEHGYPLRMIVPGYAGVRSPKWLSRITVQAMPSDNHMQQRDYKLLPPDMTPQTVDWTRGITINEMPLTSAICQPAADAVVAAGRLGLRGYAYASGRAVTRVDVSVDGARSWQQAVLSRPEDAAWSWVFWDCAVDLPAGSHELLVRAWDSAGQTQPKRAEDMWNFKGYLCASWHRVRVRAE